jgi:hypothetical protein
MPPVPPRLTLHSDGNASRASDKDRKPSDPALKRVLEAVLADAVTRAEPAPPPAIAARDGDESHIRSTNRRHQMEEIAGSLENVARLLRGRGVSALFRNEPDPLNQRLFGVIADHLSAHGSG